MEAKGLGYNALFDECAELGYLEADPNLDVGGIDAAHKLALLSSIAFGTKPNFDGIELEGIQRITLEDIHQAADMGYRIKLLGVAQRPRAGWNSACQPCLVPATSPLGQLEGGTNMVVIEGDAVEQVVLRGPGAGEGPTASAVLGDICDLARAACASRPLASLPQCLKRPSPQQTGLPAPYYLRMALLDKPGALAKVAAILGDAGRLDRPDAPIRPHRCHRPGSDRDPQNHPRCAGRGARLPGRDRRGGDGACCLRIEEL